jgi:hypothetical protein
MGVFNATQNQVLVSPVTSFYRGKAIRQQQADAEQISELRGLQIEQAEQEIADGPMNRAAAKRYAESRQDLIDIQISEAIRSGRMQELKDSAQLLEPLLVEYAQTEDEDIAVGNFNNNFKAVASLLGEQQQGKLLEVAGDDHVFDNKEIMLAGKMIQSFREKIQPETKVVGKGGALVSPTGEELYRNTPEGGDSSNELFARINPKDYTPSSVAKFQETGDFSVLRKAAAEGSGQSAKEAEIAEYEAMGHPHEFAVKLAYGKITVKENTKTGMMIYTDMTTVPPTVTEIPVAGVAPVSPESKPGRTLFALSEFASGPMNAAIRGVALPAAWLGMSVGTKQVSAKQTFQTTTQDFIRGMALSERYAVGEQDRLREDIAILPKILDDPALMRTRMISMDEDLRLRQATAENDANNTRLNPDIRQEAASVANRIKNFRAILGVPPVMNTREEAMALPPGTVFLTPDGQLLTVPE